MTILEILILAIGLSMDSFVVSLTSGAVLNPFKLRKVLKIAFFLAIFQGGMPLIGWWLGSGFKQHIESYDHWIAFAVLFFLGSKMIIEGCKKGDDTPCCFDPGKTRTLIGLSLATSIDALAVGISFAFLNMDMCMPTVIITLMTFACSIVAIYIGKYFGGKLKTSAEIFGGIILILIGLKILLEHIWLN